MKPHDSTKTRILMAAGPIFAKKGYRSATVREISDAANVNLASINYYFGDKHRLYVDTVVHARKLQAQQVPIPNWDESTLPEDKLRAYVAIILNRTVVLQSAPWQVRLLIREVIQPTDACKKLVQEYFRPFLQGLMVIIDELVSHPISPKKRLQLAFSVVGQCMFYRFAGDVAAMVIEEENLDSEFDVEMLASHIAQFSLSAIKNMEQKFAGNDDVSFAAKTNKDEAGC